MKFFIFIHALFYVLLLNKHSFAQTIEEELKNKERAEIQRTLKAQQEDITRRRRSDEIKKSAEIIVSCNPNWSGIYVFHSDIVYVYTSSFDKSKLNLSEAVFLSGIETTRTGNVIAWRTRNHGAGFAQGERWEFHLDKNKIYRKTMSDTIYQDTCNVLHTKQ